jgi:peptidoglycan lytic transglycosylase G
MLNQHQKRLIWGGSTLLALILIMLGGLFYFSTGPGGNEDTIVLIPPKSGTSLIGRKLQTAGVVRNAKVFRVYAVLTGKARKLRAGEYAFPPKASLRQVTDKLVNGKVVEHAVTIPEGFTLTQIAEVLEKRGLVSAEAFREIGTDLAITAKWDVPGTTLEGFLFPDTYKFTKGMSAKQIAKRMVNRFNQKVNTELRLAAKAQGLSLLQFITMASIIEREVRAKPEQAVVASIFYNRIQKRKRLESCATVLYAQGRISGSLSLEDLYFKSPYNTYRRRGLPPGPIGNPGLSAIRAAAYPEKTEYLFFVVRPDGTHVFSKTFAEHKRAKWRQKRAHKRVPVQPTKATTP